MMDNSSQHYLIDAQDLTFHYGEGDLTQHVLKNIALRVVSGEFIILAGPSGSGKSTLLSLIGALRPIQNGKLRVCGYDMANSSADMHLIRRQIGYVFQQHNLLNFLTARQNVEMTLEMLEEGDETSRQKKSIEILEKVGLKKEADKYPPELSVGQRQRVAIARSLVHQPRLILADEPTASLDGKSGANVVEILRDMVKTLGCGALVVTHDERIFHYADAILRIEDGVIYSDMRKDGENGRF